MTKRLAAALTLILALALPGAAPAQNLPEKPGAARTVKMFDLFCLSQLPNIEAVAELAKAGEFNELAGSELQKYQPPVKAEELRAWKYKDFDADFVLTTARTLPDAQFKKAVPEFADGTNFGCSLVIPAKDAKEALLEQMTGIMERKPDEIWDQAPLKAHAWAGQTEKMLVYVYYYAPLKGAKGGLLSANVTVKE